VIISEDNLAAVITRWLRGWTDSLASGDPDLITVWYGTVGFNVSPDAIGHLKDDLWVRRPNQQCRSTERRQDQAPVPPQ